MDRMADPLASARSTARAPSEAIAFTIMVAALVVAPFFTYPLFVMQVMCFALFACAFNLLIGYVGLLSFGHALYFGWASYLAAYAAKVWRASHRNLRSSPAPRPRPFAVSSPVHWRSAARASILP